jgi:hypothetical protein
MGSRDVVDGNSDVLVIRVWRDPESEPAFRARVTVGGEQQSVTSDPEAVLSVVRDWLAHGVETSP